MPMFMVIGWTVLKWNGNIQYMYLQTSFLYIDSCYPSLWLSVVEWMRNLRFPENYGFDTIISIALSHTPHLLMLDVHINSIRRITIHITESNIHISYSKNYDWTLMLVFYYFFTCHLFQPSSISLLRVGNTFSISSPFDATKLQKIVLTSHRLAASHLMDMHIRSQLQCTYSVRGIKMCNK